MKMPPDDIKGASLLFIGPNKAKTFVRIDLLWIIEQIEKVPELSTSPPPRFHTLMIYFVKFTPHSANVL